MLDLHRRRETFEGDPSLPIFPALPPIAPFDPYSQIADITKTSTITPGPHPGIKLSGNQILTFKGPGVYRINYIDNKNGNTFVFDFDGKPGNFIIQIHNNAMLAKLDVSIVNGGDASRIFTEVHGTGVGTAKYAFELANGSPGGMSRFSGTVWVPFAAANLGAGTGGSEIRGAVWSGTQVNIESGVNIIHAPFGVACSPPTVTANDASVCSIVDGGITALVNLNDYVTVSGGTVSFSSGGSPIANPTSYTATSGEVITVTASISATCSNTASFKVTVNDKQSFGICAPLQGKTNDLIGSELTSLSDIYKAGGTVTSSEVFFITGDKVAISIVYFPAGLNQLLTILTNLGMTDRVVNDDGTLIITGFFPIVNLPQLNALTNLINLVYPSFPAVPSAGVTTTQGDKALRSDLVRLGYDIGGAGVKIGVLSDSYSTLPNSDVSSGDLPGNSNPFGHTQIVDLVKEYPYGARTDEGRAMLQIIHDVAPEAELAFHTGYVSPYDFAKGIKHLADGCDIICDDLTYINEPFFIDGKIAEAVNYVNSQGVAYFTAAGNFGSKSYQATFNPITHNGMVKHNFGGGDVGQSITLKPGANGPATFMVVMQWEDPFFSMGTGGAQNDFDIYLTNDGGLTRFGFNRNNLNGDPFEVLTFTIREPTTTDIMIVRAAGTGNVPVKVVFFRGDNIVFNEYNNGGNGYSTIVGQANAEGAITVGAVLYSNTPEFNYARPAGSNQFEVASFSSVGGTTINGIVRSKPDFVAPNGVNTSVYMAGQDLDLPASPTGDGFPNFFGTSAAAPHAAAVAALLMEARATFEPGLLPYQPSQIKGVLQSTAKDMHQAGFDFKSGAGFLRADQALLTIASPVLISSRR